MSPKKKQKAGAKAIFSAMTAATLIAAGSLTACSHDSSSSKPQTIEMSKVSVELAYTATPRLDSIVLDCIGADTLHIVQDSKDSSFELDLFPHDRWVLSAKLYANGGLMQEGEIVTKIEAGSSVDVTIPLHAIVGFVYVEIPLGFGNPSGVASGTLTLATDDTSYSYKMTMDGVNAVFSSGMLPLGKTYELSLLLKDNAGKTIYSLQDSFLLTEDSPVPDFAVKSIRSKVQLAVSAADEVNKELSLRLPGHFRYPTSGDIVVTEVFTAVNTKDSAQYEFVELYNGSLDTLSLEGCTIGTTSVASSSCAIVPARINPGDVLVLGELGERTPEAYRNTEKWKALGNSKGSIVLQCMGAVLDSLYYADKPDSLHLEVIPAMGSSKYGQSSQLNIRKWQKRDRADSWCLSEPTPGKLDYCE
jgi:hypothetical protein